MDSVLDICEHCCRSGRKGDGVCGYCHYDGRPQNPAPALREGSVIAGRYMIGRMEGQGGFSICYRGSDGERLYAIKELFPRGLAGRDAHDRIVVSDKHRGAVDDAVRSTFHEAEVLAKLDEEPLIVRALGVEQDNDTVYLILEFLRGISFQDYLERLQKAGSGPLDVEDAIEAALMVLGALGAVHERGLLHLDVKPANVRVLNDGEDTGRIVLLDFGSAREAFRTEGAASLGSSFTPHFAAPEQYREDGTTSPATDLYAAGVMLYFSLCFQKPPEANKRTDNTIRPLLNQLNPAVPPELHAIIEKATALDPAERYANAAEFRAALKPFRKQQRDPVAPPPDARVRFAIGLLDLVAVSWAVAALAVAGMVYSVLLPWLIVWLVAQLLPAATKATPAMMLLRMRLVPERNQLSLPTLLSRALAMLTALMLFRWSTDEDGRTYHDRKSGTRVLRRAAIVAILPEAPAVADSRTSA